MPKISRILIVNPFGIGDVLFSTPMIAALKARFLGVSISYIGNGRTAPFLRQDLRIDKVLSYDRDAFFAVYQKSPWQFMLKWNAFVADLRASRFDLVFDLSLNRGLGLALKLAGIPVRIGYDHKGRGMWLTRKVPFRGYGGKHVVEAYLELLEYLTADEPCQVHGHPSAGRQSSGVCAMEIYSSTADTAWAGQFMRTHGLRPQGFVLLFPGGGTTWGREAGNKRWAPENYAKLADKIIEKASLTVILMGDQNEKELCEKVKNVMRHPAVNAAGGTSICQAAALARQTRLVIANDGGPLHVAVAAGARTVSVFGPVDENVYGPFPRAGHVIIAKDLPCRPCYRNFRMSDCQHLSCLKKLTVDEVYKRIEELL